MFGKTGAKWTEAEDIELLRLHRDGKTAVDIAVALGRPIGGVEHRLARFNLRASSSAAWRREEEQTLLDMRDRGCPWAAIAKRLRRSDEACRLKHDKLLARQDMQKDEDSAARRVSSVQKDNQLYLALCMMEAGLDVRRAISGRGAWQEAVDGLRAWYEMRCEHDVPPDFRPAKTQISFAASSSLMGSTMAMCSEVA